MTAQRVETGILEGKSEDDQDEATSEEEEPGPAEDFGLKLGVPLAVATAALLFVAPAPAVQLSSKSGEIFAVTSSGNAFFLVAVATLATTLVGGLLYPLTGHEIYEEYRTDLAMGAIIPPALIVILAFAAIILDPMIVDLLAGNVADAVLYLVIAAIVVGVLLLSNIGLLAAMIVFGVYLGIPAFVGSYVGTFIGSLAAT